MKSVDSVWLVASLVTSMGTTLWDVQLKGNILPGITTCVMHCFTLLRVHSWHLLKRKGHYCLGETAQQIYCFHIMQGGGMLPLMFV